MWKVVEVSGVVFSFVEENLLVGVVRGKSFSSTWYISFKFTGVFSFIHSLTLPSFKARERMMQLILGEVLFSGEQDILYDTQKNKTVDIHI